MEIWERTQEVVRAAASTRQASATTSRPSASRTSARRPSSGTARPASPSTTRIVWQDTRTDQICNELSADGGQDRFRAKTGLPIATYFSGPKIKWILDNVDGVRARAESRRRGVRQHRHLGDLEPHRRDRRRRSRHGRDQRQPHDADEPRDTRLGRRDPRDPGRSTRDAARDPGLERGLRRGQERAGRHSRRRATSATSRRRSSARPASRSARRRTPTARATSCSSTPGTEAVQSKSGLLTTLGYKIGDQPAVVLPRGLDRHHRRARPVAARQPRPDQGVPGGRGPREDGR